MGGGKGVNAGDVDPNTLVEACPRHLTMMAIFLGEKDG